jgi:basic membrane protein A
MKKRNGLKSAAFALAAFALVAGACGGDDAADDTATEETTAEETTEETAAPLPGAGVLACMVTDTGGVDDKGFNQISYEGMKKAEAELGVTIDLLESSSDADYAPNLQAFADKGCNITVTVGFLLGDATKAAAEANTDLNYAIVDFAYDPAVANARGLVFATDQPSFMAGYMAAAMTKTGTVATYGGINIPPVTIFMEGFRLGVEYHNAQKGTSVKLLGWDGKDGTFAGNFESLDDGKNIAKSQADEGADIIFPVAGPVGLGSAQFAKESAGKVRIIGVDVDMSKSNPDAAEVYIASVLKNIDAAVFAAIKDTVEGAATSDNYVGTLANGGVGVAFTDVPADIQSEVEAIGAGIADGSVKIGG